jgi:amino acid permease
MRVGEKKLSDISMNTDPGDRGPEDDYLLQGNETDYKNIDDAHAAEGNGCFGYFKGGLLPHGSMAASGFNLASATLGAGTLAIPAAMQACGVGLGIVLLLTCCAATVFSIRLLMVILEETGYRTYEEIAKGMFGVKFERFTAGLIVVFCWGVTLVYVVAMGEILESLNPVDGFPDAFKGTWGQRLITIIFWAIFMLPLSLMKEINSLRYASLVGMASTTVLVLAICIHAGQGPHNGKSSGENVKFAMLNINMIVAIPTFTFAFCCQTNAFEIYAELKDPSVNKMTMVAGVSMFTCTCIYIIAGSAGVSDFGDGIDSNILINYGNPTSHAYVAAAVVGISFTLTMAFPICIFPTRDAVLQMMGHKDVYETPAKTRIAVAASLATASLVVGLFVPGIGVLFGVLGGVCGSSLGFILPAVFTMKLPGWGKEKVGFGNWLATWVLLVGGVVAGIMGTVISLYETFKG